MKNELVVKNVDFCGTELLAVKKKEDGKIYVGVNSILRELGFNEKQIEYRRDKWRDDKVLSKGVLKFSGTLVGAGTGKETWCIDIMKLPLALAKIEVTPRMSEELPDLADKLEKYQDECADVLAAAFLPKKNPKKKVGANSKEAVRIHVGSKIPIVTVGNDVYEVRDNDFEIFQKFILNLYDIGMKRIPDIARAFLSVRSNKTECVISMTDNLTEVKTSDGKIHYVESVENNEE